MNDIKNILLDNSFLIRLYKQDDEFHKNVFEYFNYFLNKQIKMYLSTVVVIDYQRMLFFENLYLCSHKFIHYEYY